MHRTALVASLLAVSSAHATIYSDDDPVFGQDAVTVDTVSNLAWLDSAHTTGYSQNYVLSQLGAGGQFEGWRYASRSEVGALIGRWELQDGDPNAVQYAGLVDLIGVTWSNPSSRFVQSMTGDPSGSSSYRGVTIGDYTNPLVDDVWDAAFSRSASAGSGLVGHWLVREVPAPGTVALFILSAGLFRRVSR